MDSPANYIGIPWILGGHSQDGADCWGLTTLILKNCYGVNVDRFIGAKDSGDELAEIINSESRSSIWNGVASPKNGDVCIMRAGEKNRPEHIGVYVDGLIIHALGKNQKGSSTANKPKALLKIFNSLEYYRFVGNNNHT